MSLSIAEPHRDASTARPVSWTVIALCFLTVLLDGLDTTAIGFVVPTLAREWGLPPAAFTPAFVATSLGAVIGYLLSGRLSARYGRRAVLLGSVLIFALGSGATAWATSVPVLAWLRLFTGIGLGTALPAAIALGVENGPAHKKEIITIAVAAGLTLGTALGGGLGGPLIARFGWPGVFILGAVLPALLLPLLAWGLPKDAPQVEASTSGRAQLSGLLQPELKAQTLCIWLFAFLTFTTLYGLNFWAPSLLLSYGFSPSQAPLVVAAIGMGGVLGSVLLLPLAARFGAQRVLVGSSLLAVLLILGISQVPLGHGAVLVVFGGIGACLIAGTVGQSALAVGLYPPALRTTGVGWAAACGRIGSIVGPAVGGLLMSLGQAPQDIVLVACAPVVLAAITLLFMGGRQPDEGSPAALARSKQ